MTPSDRNDPNADAPHERRLAAAGVQPAVSASSSRSDYSPGFRARRGLNWASIGLMYTSFYMCRYNLSIANKTISHEFGFNTSQMGIIISANLLAYACGQIINGLITDRLGGKRAMLIGAAGTILFNCLFGAASFIGRLSLFATLWGMNGFAQSYGAPGMVKMNAAWFAHHERGTFAGIFGFMINLGRCLITIIGPMLLAGVVVGGMVLLPPLHWRWLFWLPAVVCAAVAVWMSFVVVETPEQAGYDYVGSRDSHADASSTAGLGLVFRTILCNPGLWVTAGAYACTGAVRQTVDQWFPRYMQDVFSLPLDSAKFRFFLAFLIPVVASAGSLMSGVISDQFFKSRRAPVAGLLYITETLIILSAAQFHTVNTAIAFFVLISFTANSTHSLLGTAAAMDIGGRKMTGFASGVIDSFQYFGGSLAGWGLGSLIQHRGWGVYFYFMVPFGIIGAILMFSLGRFIKASHYQEPSGVTVVDMEEYMEEQG